MSGVIIALTLLPDPYLHAIYIKHNSGACMSIQLCMAHQLWNVTNQTY